MHYLCSTRKRRVNSRLKWKACARRSSISDILVDENLLSEETPLSTEHREQEVDHNTYDFEQQMLSLIEFGRPDELKKLFRQPASGQAGVIAQSASRQQKNLFIVTATLVSRAAIRGGITPEDAFRLSDLYIQKVELMERNQDVAQLMVQMSIDYAKRVAALQCGDNNPILLRRQGSIFWSTSHNASQQTS